MTALPRLAAAAVAHAARVMPVTVVTGARQTGKTTLVRDLAPGGERPYFTLDDLDVLEQASDAPDDLVARAERLTLDEVQRAPQLLLAVKRAVDRRRRAGRFLLTGSANLLLMHQVSETLAGRATYLTLWPMTRREQLGMGRAGIWQELLDAKDDEWPDLIAAQPIAREDWRALARRGGFPVPALDLHADDSRATWFAGYVQTYLERDLRELSAIASLPDLRRLMRAVCLRLGQLLNQAELGRDVALPQPTVHRWMNLLETSYQLVRLHPYAVNRTKRIIKTVKVYWADTGLALHLAGLGDPAGCHLENMVLNDLLAWRDVRIDRPEVLYWRTATNEEVDFVIEAGGTLLPIEVKATAKPRVGDAKHVRTFREEYGRRCRPGLVLHTGDAIEWLAPGALAAPWWKVL
ncbi:MAG: ATP-binding protein [Acidobacteria bacterium]|nr:ATP-binding protein [Acidobacteriota bacterium]